MTQRWQQLSEESVRVFDEADCLYNQVQVETAFDHMAVAINEKLGQSNPVVLTVVNGGVVPAGCLLTRLNFPLQVDYLHATRYREKLSGSIVEWIHKQSMSLQGRVVLIVDDILDEGITLMHIVEQCRDAGASEIYSAVLVNKIHDRKADVKADFVGVEVADRYVFGYGMDYKGFLRNAPGIYAVKGM